MKDFKNFPRKFRSTPLNEARHALGQAKRHSVLRGSALGESVELLVLRKGFARQLLPDGKVGGATSHPYYEVAPVLRFTTSWRVDPDATGRRHGVQRS